MSNATVSGRFRNIAAQGGIVVFFIMAFEVMIMISPFAFFFYSVFNPILHWLQNHGATRWLTTFFLPHMILPPTAFLKTVRVLGSVLFVLGCVTFVGCALQVYLGKIFKRGVATKGLYRVIRHPQYLALGLWGIGMSILWPRFLVLASLSLMFILYYFLAKDEERRMLAQFGDSYRDYMDRTGMFLPQRVEGVPAAPFQSFRSGPVRAALVVVCVPLLVIGSGFVLRAVTLRSLSLETTQNVTLVPILPEDSFLDGKVLNQLLGAKRSPALSFLNEADDYLGYVMPPDYVMQGMIADTGGSSHLHQHHQTFGLIADWIFNPFEHLRRSPSAQMAAMHHVDPAIARRHHCPLGLDDPNLQCPSCPYRRIVFVHIAHEGQQHRSGRSLFSFDTVRVPVSFMDVDTRTGRVINAVRVGKATAWMDVPTPAI